MKTKKLSFPELEERQAVLAERRRLKMAGSAHAYVRGNTLKFYEWLEAAGGGVIPEGPPVWICGDCHVGNLGPLANAKGRIDIQIRDFDQTVIGNPAHDLIRLGLSLATAARGSDLPGVTTATMIEAMMEGYEQALEGEVVDRDEKPESVPFTQKAASRSSTSASSSRECREVTSRRTRSLAKSCQISCASSPEGKEAVQAGAPRAPNVEMPHNDAERVVEGGSPHVAVSGR
jgi:uncharacterized protein (DUF2252 family)